MKRSHTSLLLFASILLFIAFTTTFAQSTNKTSPTSEQSLEALVAEVRQLRAMLQRLNKGQVMLERLKLEQEQVASLSRDLNNVTDALNENRLQKSKVQDLLPGVQSGVEAGAINQKELTGLKTEIDLFSQREQMLLERQTRLAADLNSAQARLTALRERLSALELEMAPE
jgi:DNA repair exonuclease SbcCD ATPase subunit